MRSAGRSAPPTAHARRSASMAPTTPAADRTGRTPTVKLITSGSPAPQPRALTDRIGRPSDHPLAGLYDLSAGPELDPMLIAERRLANSRTPSERAGEFTPEEVAQIDAAREAHRL